MFLLLYRELSLQISGDELIKTMLNWIILCNSGLCGNKTASESEVNGRVVVSDLKESTELQNCPYS